MQLRNAPARRRRLSDAETEARMLDAGVRYVAAHGLSLSLEHLSMENLIQDADVSRTSSYRRWPTKDLFAADLLLKLAQATELSGDIPGLPEALAAIPSEVYAHVENEQGRRDAVVEIMRVTMETDFAAMVDSGDWRSYVVLRAAHGGLPDGELRARVTDALRETEDRFTRTRAAALALMSSLIGYRLVDEAPTWEHLSLSVGAMATGMLVRGYSDQGAVTTTYEHRAFGSTRSAPWSTATRALVGVLLSSLEPDPTITWDAERIAGLRSLVDNIDETARQALVSVRVRGEDS